MRAILLSVGSELVCGQTVDTNSAYLAQELGRAGIETVEHLTVGDDAAALAAALRRAADAAELVVVTGGLGPTADDVTREALAAAMGAELVEDPASVEHIAAFFRRRGRTMAPANRRQALLPTGAEALDNPAGTAPGISARLGRARVFVLPGVPHEMRRMFAEQVAGRLPPGGAARAARVVHTFGAGESDVGARLETLMRADGPVRVGTTVAAGLVSVRIWARGASPDEAAARAEQTVAEVRRRLGDLVVGEDDETMAEVVGRALRQAGQTLATAESCTGGLIGQMITAVPGSSDYYLGGVVAYANAVKQRELDVPAALLAEHGAVSEPVARAMAAGCRARFAADWALGVTGIAGPAGGTADKPVGLVFVGLAGPEEAGDRDTPGGPAGRVDVQRHVFPGTRDHVRLRAALTALNMLRRRLTPEPE